MKVPWKLTQQPGDADWQRVAIYGFGASGQAAAAFLRARGVEAVIFDRRSREEIGALFSQDPKGDEGIEWHLGSEPEGDVSSLLHGLDGIVVSPGVPPDRPLLAQGRQKGLPVIGEVELAFPFLRGEVIGITGSNGKSTTTAMTGAMLRQAGHQVEICGNIGVPLCSVIDSDDNSQRLFVVELSSFQLETVDTFRPKAAALLNLSADHLDRHQNMEGYRDAKARLFNHQRPNDIAVLNADDPWVADLALASRRRSFSLLKTQADGCHASQGQVWEQASPEASAEALFDVEAVPLPGPHNLENAMAAALLARTFGVSASDLAESLRQFRGLPHRMEKVAEIDGVLWYDDSKGTNPGATERSLEGFADRQLHLILGGRNKGAEFDRLCKAAARKARWVYLVGESAASLEALLRDTEVRITHSETLDRAVEQAAENANSGEVVLLSPACASFDQFRNFVERGQVFQRLVNALGVEVNRG